MKRFGRCPTAPAVDVRRPHAGASPPGIVFVNADEIANNAGPTTQHRTPTRRRRSPPVTRARSSTWAGRSLPRRCSLHPSKLELIRVPQKWPATPSYCRRVGYPEGLAVERVRHRVAAGGHDAPETKIRERHRWLAELLSPRAITLSTAPVYDNSWLAASHVAQLSGVASSGACWPSWTPPP